MEKMNKEKIELIARGIKLLIENSNTIKGSEKYVWNYDYKELFPEEDE